MGCNYTIIVIIIATFVFFQVLKADVDNSLEDGSSSGKTGGPILPFDLLRTYPRVSLKDCEDLNVSGAGLENIAIKVEYTERGDD